jgi:hypothetical protein
MLKRYNKFFKEDQKFELVLSLKNQNVSRALNLLKDLRIPYRQEYSNNIILKNEQDYEDVLDLFKKYKIELE